MPVETPPSRPKKPCAMPGSAARLAAAMHARFQSRLSEAGRRRRRRAATGQRLEQGSHLVGPVSRSTARPAGRGLGRIGFHQLLGPRADAERGQEFALGAGPNTARRHAGRPRPGRRNRHGRKDRASPGSASTSAKAMTAHRLQGFAKAGLAHSHNRASAPRRRGRDDAGDFFGQGGGGGRGFIDAAFGRAGARCREWRRRASAAAPARKPARRPSATTMRSHQPRAVFTYWRIGRASKNSLASSNSGRSPASSKCVVQRIRAPLSCNFSRWISLQGRAGLDQHHFELRPEIPAPRFSGPQGIGHQGAAPGPQFHQPGIFRAALIGPGLHAPQAQHLAEHLADLRRGDEIAARAERIAGGVIAGFGDRAAPGS